MVWTKFRSQKQSTILFDNRLYVFLSFEMSRNAPKSTTRHIARSKQSSGEIISVKILEQNLPWMKNWYHNYNVHDTNTIFEARSYIACFHFVYELKVFRFVIANFASDIIVISENLRQTWVCDSPQHFAKNYLNFKANVGGGHFNSYCSSYLFACSCWREILFSWHCYLVLAFLFQDLPSPKPNKLR